MVVLFFQTGHLLLTLNILFAALTDVDHHYRKETDEVVQKTSTSTPISPLLSSVPRSSLARDSSLTSSTFSDGNQDPHLLADDGLSSPTQPSFKYSARHPPEVSPTIPASNASYRLPSENDIGHRDVRSPPTGTDQGNPPSLGSPDTYLHREGFSADPTRRNANTANYTKADGLPYNEDSTQVDLEGDVEMEIDDLLEDLTDYYSGRTTMTSVPLLPLPEELSPADGPLNSQPYTDRSPPPLATANTPYSGDSDTVSLTPSSPQSSKGSYFSSASPSLKSKRSFTPITPSTDGWRSPPTLAAVAEHKASADYFDYVRAHGRPGLWSLDPRQAPEDATRGSYPRVSSENRRAHHTNLPPLRTTIPEDSIIQRRPKYSTSSHRVETSVDHSVSSYFSDDDDDDDDDASEITEIGYVGSGFDPARLSASSTVPFTRSRPWLDASRGPGSNFHSGYSPSSSISPGPIDYPPPSNNRYTMSPKRGMFQSLFSQNGTSERKKERKRAKARDSIQTQSLDVRSIDAVSFTTTSSKSSNKAEKAAKNAQLAAQLSTKRLLQAGDKGRVPQKGSATWEESGAMYSMDGIF